MFIIYFIYISHIYICMYIYVCTHIHINIYIINTTGKYVYVHLFKYAKF